MYAVYPQYLKEELDRVQSRSLRVIVLPRNYLTTLTEGTNEATSRYLDTTTGHPAIFLTNNLWVIIILTIILDTETKYMHIPLSGTERRTNSFIPPSDE